MSNPGVRSIRASPSHDNLAPLFQEPPFPTTTTTRRESTLVRPGCPSRPCVLVPGSPQFKHGSAKRGCPTGVKFDHTPSCRRIAQTVTRPPLRSRPPPKNRPAPSGASNLGPITTTKHYYMYIIAIHQCSGSVSEYRRPAPSTARHPPVTTHHLRVQ